MLLQPSEKTQREAGSGASYDLKGLACYARCSAQCSALGSH